MTKIIHGHAMLRTAEYAAWQHMKARCRPDHPASDRYAERGIEVCARWLDGEAGLTGFQCFLEDVGARPSEGHSIDRKENSEGYTPTNCRWATDVQQNRNRRFNRIVEIAGEKLTFVEAVEKHGKVSWATARMRVHTGWDDVAAITQPKGMRRSWMRQ